MKIEAEMFSETSQNTVPFISSNFITSKLTILGYLTVNRIRQECDYVCELSEKEGGGGTAENPPEWQLDPSV